MIKIIVIGKFLSSIDGSKYTSLRPSGSVVIPRVHALWAGGVVGGASGQYLGHHKFYLIS